MPDPWVQGEDLEKHEKAVKDSYLTKQAEELREQDKKNVKVLIDERHEAEYGSDKDAELTPEQEVAQSKPAAEGKNADAVTGGMGTSGEQTPEEPAGNADSDKKTAAEKKKADENKAADKKS